MAAVIKHLNLSSAASFLNLDLDIDLEVTSLKRLRFSVVHGDIAMCLGLELPSSDGTVLNLSGTSEGCDAFPNLILFSPSSTLAGP